MLFLVLEIQNLKKEVATMKEESKKKDSPLSVDEIVIRLLKEDPATHSFTLASIYAHKGGAVISQEGVVPLIHAFSGVIMGRNAGKGRLTVETAIKNLHYKLGEQMQTKVLAKPSWEAGGFTRALE